MRIEREFGGTTFSFDLTFEERRKTYLEEQHNYDIQDIETELLDCTYELQDNETVNLEGEKIPMSDLRQMLEDKDMMECAAKKLREWFDENDNITEILWRLCREAIAETCIEFKQNKEGKTT